MSHSIPHPISLPGPRETACRRPQRESRDATTMTQVTLGRRLIDLKMRWSRALCLPTDKTLWERWHQTTESEIRCLPDGSRWSTSAPGAAASTRARCVPASSRWPSTPPPRRWASTSTPTSRLSPTPAIPCPCRPARPICSTRARCSSTLPTCARRRRPWPTSCAGRAHGPHHFRALQPVRDRRRVLPFKPVLWLLHRVDPTTIDHVGFDVFYDRAWPAAIESTSKEAGLRTIHVEVPAVSGLRPVQAGGPPAAARWMASYLLITAER